jgi:hypothetical protein
MIKLEVRRTPRQLHGPGVPRARRFRARLPRGGFAAGEKVALKIGDVAGGGRYVTRFLEITNKRKPEGISPDETPAEAVFFRQDGVRIDFLDVHEIDDLVRSEYELLASAIKSPNVVRRARVFTHEGRPIVSVMDYVRGKTLREKIRALEGIRLNWFLTIVRALQKLRGVGRRSRTTATSSPRTSSSSRRAACVLVDPAMRARRARRDHDDAALQPAPPAHVEG